MPIPSGKCSERSDLMRPKDWGNYLVTVILGTVSSYFQAKVEVIENRTLT